MGTDILKYDQMVQDALRGVVRDALAQVATHGFPARHHFFITFQTGHPGVDIPDYLRDRYPGEMTIVLQNQYSGLEVAGDVFSVTLTFNKVPERLTIPLAAISRFVDPPANFGLQLSSGSVGGGPITAEGATAGGNDGKPAEFAKEQPKARGGKAASQKAQDRGKVVALDSFRKP
ncbi:MAG: ClpXP protease specificity-enhancing factor SspB [Alphaproteobacteria bacterium]